MITILLATYNGERYIGELLSSIEAQTCSDWRIIVSDDMSRDATPEIVKSFAKAHPGRVMLYEAGRRMGSARSNFMELLRVAAQCPGGAAWPADDAGQCPGGAAGQADDAAQCPVGVAGQADDAAQQAGTSEYFMCCDQDDVWLPDKIERTLAVMKATEAGEAVPTLVHTDLRPVDAELNVIAASMFRYQRLGDLRDTAQLMVQNCVTGCTVMINRQLLDIAVRSDNDDHILMHDHWLALCASIYGRIGFLPEATILYRQHGDNSVGLKNASSPRFLLSRIRLGRQVYLGQVRATMRQAALLGRIVSESGTKDKAAELLLSYGELETAGYLRRQLFYMAHGAKKHGFFRRLAQIIWG